MRLLFFALPWPRTTYGQWEGEMEAAHLHLGVERTTSATATFELSISYMKYDFWANIDEVGSLAEHVDSDVLFRADGTPCRTTN